MMLMERRLQSALWAAGFSRPRRFSAGFADATSAIPYAGGAPALPWLLNVKSFLPYQDNPWILANPQVFRN